MPMYRFRVTRAQGSHFCEERGFYREQAAIEHARKMRARGNIEIWLADELVALIEPVVASSE